MSTKKHEVKYIRLGIDTRNERWGRTLCLTQTCRLSYEVFDDVPVTYLEKALQITSRQTGKLQWWGGILRPWSGGKLVREDKCHSLWQGRNCWVLNLDAHLSPLEFPRGVVDSRSSPLKHPVCSGFSPAIGLLNSGHWLGKLSNTHKRQKMYLSFLLFFFAHQEELW